MVYTIQHAKANFARLIDEARSGNEVIIAGIEGMVRLVPIFTSLKKRKPRRPKGKISDSDDTLRR